MKKRTALSFLSSLLIASSAGADQQLDTVTVTSSEPRQPTAVEKTLSVSCEQWQFDLVITGQGRGKQALLFRARGEGKSIEKDLTASPFWRYVNTAAFMGNWAFSCSWQGPNVGIVGLSMKPGQPPSPISYSMTISSTGEIAADSGVRSESMEYVAGKLTVLGM